MSTKILINAQKFEVRIALIENGILSEFHLQRPSEKGLIGNIYRGRIVRVLPGMQAAFVNIGLERTGFLYVDDVYLPNQELDNHMLISEGASEEQSYIPILDEQEYRRTRGLNIEDLLVEGQDILVQVSKDPIGTKGARLTCHITLPGRNLVFIPLNEHIGISRKIEDEGIRNGLKEKIERLRPPGTGFIIRTVAEFATDTELEADMHFLLHLWQEIQDIAAKSKIPSLVYEDLDITFRCVRDLFTHEVDSLITDNEETFQKLKDFVKNFAPNLQDRLALHENDTPLFDAHGITKDIRRAIEKKVWLQSGGYIIIESTEALSVIDVNTGRFVGKNNLNETIFKTNMEAAKEIAYQLRLRNIGGIIIVDFIDMETEEHRESLFASFKDALKKDKSRINILRLSEFGLIQMTRKRTSENLTQMMCEPCHYCAGEGILKSRRTICYEIFRKISRNAKNNKGTSITIRVHPRVAEMLETEEKYAVTQIEKEIFKELVVVPVADMHIEKYDIIW